MAKFLDTTGVSYHLQQRINKANEKLVIISPYLKINERIKQSLEDKNRMKIDIRIVYGKNELHPDENNWLKSMTSIRSSFCKDLHAKCYLNENEAILTSMCWQATDIRPICSLNMEKLLMIFEKLSANSNCSVPDRL